MEVKPALALPAGLEVTALEEMENVLTITAVSTQVHPACPVCGMPAVRVHSRYTRQVADLPCGGHQVRLRLQVRKFFCDVLTCARRVNARAPDALCGALGARDTAFVSDRAGDRSGDWRQAGGGTDRLGILTSRHTILRRIMALPTDPVGQVIELGIDDFLFRRGRTFGTLLVNLQTRRVLDVLPDRTADTSAAWMAAHSEIEVVSRDRGGDYAAAARKAAPGAKQTADRFHLLKNLGEALQGVLARHLAAQRKRQTETARASPLQTSQMGAPPKVIPKSVALSQAKREQRLAHYQHVVALREQGFSQTAIAGQVGISHATVSRWLNHGTFPEQKPRPRSASVDPYLPQLVERWKEGLHTVAELHRELVAGGYSHQYNSVYRRLVRSFPEGQKKRWTRSLPAEQKKQETADQPPQPPVLARQAMFLFLRQPEALEADEQDTLTLLRSLHAEVDQAYELVQQFAQMVRMRTGEQLDDWLCRVKASRIRELQGFVTGVIQDKEAVKAGLTSPASNGLVEGKINKLKLIRRMGYGRAGFPLLRQRVLHAL